MDVVQSNFEEALALLEALLPRAEFISIDCEMTGIRGRAEMWLDSPQLRYNKLKFIASRYRLIQVGVAVFYHDGGELKALPLNFYVFPRNESEKVILEVGAIAFNRKNDMDFNKWIYEGIHYIDEQGEALLHNRLYGVSDPSAEIVLHRQRDIELFIEVTAKVHAWYESGETELELSALNAFHRKYFYQKLLKEFPGVTTETCGDARGATLKLRKEIMVDSAQLKEERQRLKMQDGLGFRRVFKMLTAAKKPLLGHNLLIDLLFIYASFKGKLPLQLADFQAMVQADFPEIYDTRHMYLSIPGFRQQFETERVGSSLTELHEYLREITHFSVPLALGCEKYAGKKAHEAGYDAYVTGEVFLMLRGRGDIQEYCNLLTLYRSIFTINLAGGTVLPAGEILVVKGQDLLVKLDGFNVKKINDTLAFLILDTEQALAFRSMTDLGLEVFDLDSQLIHEDSPEQ
jgi:hypothetical protein